jgi:outer membrane biosynthesis protein TonB
MNRFCKFLVVFAINLFTVTQRLPAPIVEEEKPMPAPQRSAKPKPKRTTKPKIESEKKESVNQPARRTIESKKSQVNAQPQKKFSGIWRGTINCGIWGSIEHRIIIDDTQKSMTVSKIGIGPGGANGTAAATLGPDGLSAQLPGVNGKWSLQPNTGGKTARVRLDGFMHVSSAVFTREQ